MAETTEQPAAIETKIAEYSPTAAALANLRQRFGSLAFDLTTVKGDKEARAARMELVKLRTSLEAKRKELKAPALERSRLIDEEAKRITGAILALETPIDEQIRAAEEKKEAERLAKIESEQRRIFLLNDRIDEIKAVAARAVGKPSTEIQQKIQLVAGMTIGDTYQEMKPAAEQARAATLATLRELHAAALAQEAEAARIAEERAELERQRAAQAEADRIERERIAAEQKAAADKLAKEREAFEAQQAAQREKQEAQLREQRAAQERADAAARAEREAADRKAAAERAEADRVARERQLAEEARLDAERAELRKQQEAQARIERERREAEEQRQADERDRLRREQEERDRVALEAAEAEQRQQAEARAEQRRQEEAAAIADKRVRDHAQLLLTALLKLTSIVKGMSHEDQDQRPTDAELDAAIAGADAAIALAVDSEEPATR